MEYIRTQCINCGEAFSYLRYRADKHYCSKECRNRYYYVHRGSYENRSRRTKMSPEEFKEHKKRYDRERLQIPAIRHARNERDKERYATEEYRAYSRDRYRLLSGGSLYNNDPIQHGYTGHRWFDLVREHVGPPPPADSIYFDKWADRMGVGILALLEGKDVDEAIKEHNKKEYVPNNRMIFMSDWIGENEYKQAFIGTAPSAEEEAINQESRPPRVKARYSGARGPRRFGKGGSHLGRTAPTRRDSFRDYQDRPGNRR